MVKRAIEMHYHPAIKTVKFFMPDGTPTKSSKLLARQNDKFVLQEQGNALFSDISSALDKVKQIELCFFGTQVDYEDLQGMVKYYNDNNEAGVRISLVHSKTLLGMNEMYSIVEKFGFDAIKALQKRIDEFDKETKPLEIRDKFKFMLSEYIKTINSKIDSLRSTGINICFVGTYSSGKSSLINAIIGEKILPEDNESKTAKFYIINAPQVGETDSISFELNGEDTVIEWNGKSLELDKNLGSHEFRTIIQNCLDKNQDNPKHLQFYNLLDLINSSDDVDVKINIKYNLSSINDATMSFTIYDTPGTGSNTYAHQNVLEEALKEQSHSIVVFVGGVTKLEGEGNSLLLELLGGSNGSSIDLDRSLYVINRSDTTDVDELIKYQTETIRLKDASEVAKAKKDDEKKNVDVKKSISLEDKKLFFTSASQAYASKAIEKGIATEKETRIWKKTLDDEIFYEFNRYGRSEAATERIINDARNAARNAATEYQKKFINAGLLSLINAIKEYGNKYAMATKVNSLITTVIDVLEALRDAANKHKKLCDEEIDKLEKDLDIINGQLMTLIEVEYEKHVPRKTGDVYEFNKKKAQLLNIDEEEFTNAIDKITQDVDNMFKFGRTHRKKKVDDDKISKPELFDKIKKGISDQTDKFNSAQEKLLEEEQDTFKRAIINAIDGAKDLTEDARSYLKTGLEDVVLPDKVNYTSNIKNVIEQSTYQVKFLGLFDWFDWDWYKIDTDKLIDGIKALLRKTFSSNGQSFYNNYAKNLQTILDSVKSTFLDNKGKYFASIQSIKTAKDLVMTAASGISSTAAELNELMIFFDNLIWDK